MGRKRVLKLSKTALINCPSCGKRNRIEVPSNFSSVYSVECKECDMKITTPSTRCCLICAFSDKKCAPSLSQEARIKGLEFRVPN